MFHQNTILLHRHAMTTFTAFKKCFINRTPSMYKLELFSHCRNYQSLKNTRELVSASKIRKGTRKSFSSSTRQNSNENDESIKTCSNYLSVLFEGDTSKGIKAAQLLSPTAREELIQAHQKISLESVSTQTQGVTEPDASQLRLHAYVQGIPFIGFGICDNAIMIIAGEMIDSYLGVIFGISTLCAAAIGNILSDVAGVGLGTFIEDFCATKLRLPVPTFTNAQRQLRSVRFAGQIGTAIGLTVGCIIGMFPLLFMDTENVQQRKRDARMEHIFKDMEEAASSLLGAESTRLLVVVDTEKCTQPSFETSTKNIRDKFLYGKFESNENTHQPTYSQSNILRRLSVHVDSNRSICSKAVTTGEIINVKDVSKSEDYNPVIDAIPSMSQQTIKSMLCVPVFDIHGNVIAVIQAINKIKGGIATEGVDQQDTKNDGFTKSDSRVLKALATHVSVSLQSINSDDESRLRDTMKILKEHGVAALGDGDKIIHTHRYPQR